MPKRSVLRITEPDLHALNIIKAAKHFGKHIEHFFENCETLTYKGEMAALTPAHSRGLVEATPGRYGGTWAHPKLAVFFARWLDVRFSVWCDAMIEDIQKGGR